jgi:hypothetical protein
MAAPGLQRVAARRLGAAQVKSVDCWMWPLATPQASATGVPGAVVLGPDGKVNGGNGFRVYEVLFRR